MLVTYGRRVNHLIVIVMLRSPSNCATRQLRWEGIMFYPTTCLASQSTSSSCHGSADNTDSPALCFNEQNEC